MSTIAFLAAALLVQPAPAVAASEAGADRVEVGYAELSEGRATDAVDRILGSQGRKIEDPAALINLGVAYARLGKVAKARDAYRAAIASSERYDLELADGRWMDSRQAARLADRMLYSGTTLAIR
jgi:Flp pilus assembly protein TadD